MKLFHLLIAVALAGGAAAGEAQREVRVRQTDGGPMIHVDGHVVPPRMFWGRSGSHRYKIGEDWTPFALTFRAPAAVTNGVAALKIVELGVTNIPMSECGDFAMIARVMGYSGDTLPFRRLLLASDVTPLKNGFYDALPLCNGYPVLHIGTDLSAPRSEWLETGWPV